MPKKPPSAAKAANARLLDRVLTKPRNHNKGWMALLSPSQLAELEEVKALFQKGQLHQSAAAICEAVKEQWGIAANDTTLLRWLRK